MRTLPDGRRVVAWISGDPGTRLVPHGQAWEQSVCALADALADTAELFNLAGRTVLWRDGQFIPVDGTVLAELMQRYVCMPWVADEKLEYVPIPTTGLIIRTLLNDQGTAREGALLPRLPRIYGSSSINEIRRPQKVHGL